MSLTLSILYRGPLSSCNYDCSYCPFAKRHDRPAQLAADRQALERFVAWIAARRDDRLSVLFTPWGEALIRPWYHDALARLTHLPQIVKAAVQTNLSCRLEWLANCELSKLALWCTYHPSQTSRTAFLSQCRQLAAVGARYSVGMVGLKEDLAEVEALRQELPPHVYLWINAYKRVADYYTTEEVARCTAVDRLFPWNLTRHASRGQSCRAGEQVISVDGDGVMRRCHFIAEPIGNLYDPDFASALQPRLCTNDACGCHIGYVHLDRLGLTDLFADGLLERVPPPEVWQLSPSPAV